MDRKQFTYFAAETAYLIKEAAAEWANRPEGYPADQTTVWQIAAAEMPKPDDEDGEYDETAYFERFDEHCDHVARDLQGFDGSTSQIVRFAPHLSGNGQYVRARAAFLDDVAERARRVINDTGKVMREACGLSQADLARVAGVNQATAARWEQAGELKSDVSDLLLGYAADIRNTITWLLENILDADSGDNSTIAIIRYEAQDWPAACLVDGGVESLPHAVHESIVRTAAIMSPRPVPVVRFNPIVYAAWLGERDDTRRARAEWARVTVQEWIV